MNILVIKQTSLGDVLHSTGHIRTIKENFPHCRLTLLTADVSADIYRHNPWVDDMILLERRRIKRQWRRRPLDALRHIAESVAQVRAQRFELAFDLQGLGKSALFLYAARAREKYIKGHWLGLRGFRNPALHAIAEMDGVLKRARLALADTSMEFFTSAAERQCIDALLAQINPNGKPLLVFSPFSRWPSKNWPLRRYIEVAAGAGEVVVAITGTADSRLAIEQAIDRAGAESTPPKPLAEMVNLAGRLALPQFAELVDRAALMLSGDSFPMHVACAKNTPVIALFGPTDEAKTGPAGARHEVIRAPGCSRCDQPACRRRCLARLSSEVVRRALQTKLEAVNLD